MGEIAKNAFGTTSPTAARIPPDRLIANSPDRDRIAAKGDGDRRLKAIRQMPVQVYREKVWQKEGDHIKAAMTGLSREQCPSLPVCSTSSAWSAMWR